MVSQTSLVWFKRDLRTLDHEPLSLAMTRGPCICLYIYEPEVLHAPDFDPSHLVFINQALTDLKERIRVLGGELIVRHGEAVDVLQAIYSAHPFSHLMSHQETGNMVTYRRDQRVAAWAKTQGVEWHESLQHGVFRGLQDRDGWSRTWTHLMRAPIVSEPEHIVTVPEMASGTLLSDVELGLEASEKNDVQIGGVTCADTTLESFFRERGREYRTQMSSPVTAGHACSRLSPYLAYGNLSMRTVLQRTEAFQERAKAYARGSGRGAHPWRGSLASFAKRLRWHCHFIQKLESQPSLEFENMARVYDGLRENDFQDHFFEAGCRGQTGYPMVDACMRSLHATGWVNFRMRAMLMSFASYHLWLHWRPTSLFLARQFIDYEPGIHYSQAQMQSGTTGINSVRIYSPIKQVRDHDPEGLFIRQWVPELALVPSEFIAQPETMPFDVQISANCVIGQDYPSPIVEHTSAVKEARRKLFSVRSRADARMQAQQVFQRHGSRRKPKTRRSSRRS